MNISFFSSRDSKFSFYNGVKTKEIILRKPLNRCRCSKRYSEECTKNSFGLVIRIYNRSIICSLVPPLRTLVVPEMTQMGVFAPEYTCAKARRSSRRKIAPIFQSALEAEGSFISTVTLLGWRVKLTLPFSEGCTELRQSLSDKRYKLLSKRYPECFDNPQSMSLCIYKILRYRQACRGNKDGADSVNVSES